METLTYFIDGIFLKAEETIGEEIHQVIENTTITKKVYGNLVISGSRISEVVFEEVVFENCTFFGSQLVNCLFINCLFINCKFKFSQLTDCNFEHTLWENCMWGLSAIKDSEMNFNESIANKSFESTGTGMHTKSYSLVEFLQLTA